VRLDQRYSTIDKLLHRLSFSTTQIQVELDDLEARFWLRTFPREEIERPVFITALPRAGTTLLLEICAGLEEFATHTYRDMPFVLLPIIWNEFSKRFRKAEVPIERAHGDGMIINYESPEAFEEMVWKAMWPDQYLSDRIALWPKHAEKTFTEYFTRHVRKIIHLRQNTDRMRPRYLSKNNFNIARIPLLLEIFPDARIVILVRDPMQHSASLHGQHLNFIDIHSRDPFARDYMKGIGHFDFGDNLRPINFSNWRDRSELSDAKELTFWLEYWFETYNYLRDLQTEQVKLVPYEMLCECPAAILGWLGDFLELRAKDAFLGHRDRITPAKPRPVVRKGINEELVEKAYGLYEDIKQAALG